MSDNIVSIGNDSTYSQAFPRSFWAKIRRDADEHWYSIENDTIYLHTIMIRMLRPVILNYHYPQHPLYTPNSAYIPNSSNLNATPHPSTLTGSLPRRSFPYQKYRLCASHTCFHQSLASLADSFQDN